MRHSWRRAFHRLYRAPCARCHDCTANMWPAIAVTVIAVAFVLDIVMDAFAW